MKVIILICLGLYVGLLSSFCQQSVNTSANVCKSNIGVVSYSIGQVFTAKMSGNNANLSHGVHQPNSSSKITTINSINSRIDCFVYPNPVVDNATICINSDNLSNINYSIINSTGAIIMENNISAPNTSFNMSNFPAGSYFLKLIENNQSITTITIIKK